MSSDPTPEVPISRRVIRSRVGEAHAIRWLLLGFLVEGGTELYQFAERGNFSQNALVYGFTLATTILGFVLMFLGFREWKRLHPSRIRRAIPWPLIELFANAGLSIALWLGRHSRRIRQKYFLWWSLAVVSAAVTLVVAIVAVERRDETPTVRASRPIPWKGLTFFAGGTGSCAALSLVLGGAGTGGSPFWVAWPVGGLIVLALGNFFLGLRNLVRPAGTRVGGALAWGAFIWSLGVATVTGLAVGQHAVQLLVEFATDWAALFTSAAPILADLATLFVSYALLTVVYFEARRETVGRH
jgi:hypothetical protein